MKRRDFVKYAGGGLAALVVGSVLPAWVSNNSLLAVKQVQELSFTITDAVKDMITHNENNSAQCYFWLYKEANFPAEIPGPHIFTTVGSIIKVTITNELDEPHAFFIEGMVNSGPIPPGATKKIQFVASKAGTFLYYDNLNAPVNRIMGLHGALVVMPNEAVPGHKFTPYATPTPAVQQLFDDFGTTTHFPKIGSKTGDVDISVRLSPICYPMHDHSETSQSSQGGNYGMGMMSGLEFIGDRNTPGGVTTFPGAATYHGPDATGPAAGTEHESH
jgi:hypothetical protein